MTTSLSRHINKKKQLTTIDKLMNVAAVAHPLTALPQVYLIYTTRNVSGISLWTWSGFMLLGLIFLAYAITHKIRPIILTQLLWYLIDFAIVIGVILYR